MRNECNIIRDILPLYIEDMVSICTADFVEEHLRECDACRAELENMKKPGVFERSAFEETSDGKEAIKTMQGKLRRRSIKNMLSGATAAILLFILSLFLHSYFKVDGTEIAGVDEISETCMVTLIEYQHMDYENRTEYVLNDGEVQILKKLLQSSSFTRALASAVSFEDYDHYDIRIDYQDGQNFLSISCIGNEYISVVNQFGGKHLKVNNPYWEKTLSSLASPNE